MADDVTYTNTSPAGPPDGTKQATDSHATRGHMPIVKLAYSADGIATHVPADADGLLVNLGANNDVTVAGVATAANQSTGNTALAAIQTAVETLDNAIAGSEMQVDVVTLPALAAGNNNIGDVDVASLPALAAGTNTIGSTLPNQYELAGNTTHVKKYYTNSGAVTDGIIWSPASGKRWYVTDIFINVSDDATVTLEDDKAGGDEAIWKAELLANSGWSHSFHTPWFSGEDAADLIITTSAGNVYVMVTGYEI